MIYYERFFSHYNHIVSALHSQNFEKHFLKNMMSFLVNIYIFCTAKQMTLTSYIYRSNFQYFLSHILSQNLDFSVVTSVHQKSLFLSSSLPHQSTSPQLLYSTHPPDFCHQFIHLNTNFTI